MLAILDLIEELFEVGGVRFVSVELHHILFIPEVGDRCRLLVLRLAGSLPSRSTFAVGQLFVASSIL